MSSSKPAPGGSVTDRTGRNVPVMHWALDEFEMPDIFSADEFEGDVAEHDSMHADGAEAHEAHEAQPDVERLTADAYARGRAEGERKAQAMAESEIAPVLSALNDAIATVQLHQARWLSNTEEHIAALAVAVARHVLTREVTADATHVRALVAEALSQYPLDSQIVVRLNPDDIAACNTVVVTDNAGRAADVRWTADPQVVRGGCLVEGRERVIDGRIDTLLERLYRSIGNVQA